MQQNRRTFIKFTVAGIVIAAAGYTVVKLVSPLERSIASILERELEGLKVGKKDIARFAEIAAKQNPWDFGPRTRKLLGLYSSVNVRHLPLPFKKEYKDHCDKIVEKFLLSTDFFINKMDESKPVVFSGRIWGPYATPCMNPFSAIFYPSV